jgi:hypothetical protein
MAQPVINIRFPVPPQDDTPARQRGQRRQCQAIQHDNQDYASRRTTRWIVPGHHARAQAPNRDDACVQGVVDVQ